MFTSGSTIVIFPPVNETFEVFNLKELPPCPTLVAASPALLLSTIISPPVWLNVLPATWTTLPLTVNVPPETVFTPLFEKTALLFVQPTVKLPDAFTKVAPEFIVTPAALFPAEFTVTVWPFAIVTTSLQDGTPLGDQVAASFQFPVIADVFVVVPWTDDEPIPT